jgi:hypothetical protein
MVESPAARCGVVAMSRTVAPPISAVLSMTRRFGDDRECRSPMMRCYRSAMPRLPESEIYLLVRTYFGDEAGWDALRAEIDEGSEEGFFANVQYVNDRQFEGFSSEALETAHPHRVSGWDVMYVADEQAITHPVHPLLLVRVGSTEDLPFRCRADALYEVDANLSLANLDWEDFRDQVDASGVYGGVEVAQPPTDPATNPLIAAYRSASDEPITIHVPGVPTNLWADIFNDLWEAPVDDPEVGYKEVQAISRKIVERDQPTKEQPEDDAVITLPANEWAFIRERARRLQSKYALGYRDGRRREAVGQIIELISRHIP